MNEYSTAAGIAGDLAMAIHRGDIQPGEQLPTQQQLAAAYDVATATVSAAVNRVATAGLAHSAQGRRTYAVDQYRQHVLRPPVLALLKAADELYELAASNDGATTALEELDRRVLRGLGDAFAAAARRVIGHGLTDDDAHLIAAAESVIRDGGYRPDGQPPIAQPTAWTSSDEAYARRLWPERTTTTSTTSSTTEGKS